MYECPLMPAQLVALNEGPNILVDKPILLVGRHPECDIQIDSRKISRRHCCIAQVNDYLVIRDLDSTNGVRINGVRVVEGRLHPGDELTIGNHRYQVTWEGGDQPAPSSAPAQKKAPPPTPLHPASALPAAVPILDDDMLTCQQHCWSPSRCLISGNGLAPRLRPRDAAGDANSGSLELNLWLRLGLNS